MIKKILIIVVLIITAISFSNIAIANDRAYDEQEAIRRAVKQLQDIDKYEKKQAKKRWDDKYRSTNDEGSGPLTCLCCAGVIIAIVVGVKKKNAESEKTEQIKSIKERNKRRVAKKKEDRENKKRAEDKQRISKLLATAKQNGFSVEEQNKKCTQCAESIKLEAKTCRYCGASYTANDNSKMLLSTLKQYLKTKTPSANIDSKEEDTPTKEQVVSGNKQLRKKERQSTANNKNNRWIREGIRYYKSGKYKEASVAFSNAIESGQDKAQAYFYRACSYQKLNDKQRQKKDILIAAKLGHPKALEFCKKSA